MANEAQIVLTAKDKASGVVNRLTGTMDRMARRADQIAGKARRILMIGGALGVGGVKAMMDFETQMAMVGTMLVDGAEKWLPEFSEGMQQLSMEFGESTKTLAKGLYDLLSASVPPQHAMKALRIAAESAAGGFTTTAVAVDGLTTLMNAFGVSAEHTGVVADLMFATVRRGKLTFDQLAKSIGMVAPIAKVAGMSMDNMLAAIATMTRQGLTARQSTVRLSALLRSVPEAGEALHKLIESFRGKNLADILEMIPESRAAQAIAALGQDYEGFAKDMNIMLNSMGSRMTAFRKVQDTFGFKWGQIKQTVIHAARAIGRSLIPAITPLVEWLKRVALKVSTWVLANKELFASIVKWTVGILVAIVIMPKLIALVSVLTKALMFLATTPFGMILTALAAIAAAFTYAAGDGENFKARMLDGLSKIVEALDHILGSWEGFRAGIALIGSQISALFKRNWIHLKIWLARTAADMVDGFAAAWEIGLEKVKLATAWVWKWLQKGWSGLVEHLSKEWAHNAAGLKRIWAWVKQEGGEEGRRKYEAERKRIDEEFNRRMAEASKKGKDSRLAADEEYVKQKKALEDQLADDLTEIGQRNLATHTALEEIKQRELDETEATRRKKLEKYLASLAKLPRLSDKIKDIWARLEKGLSLESSEEEIKRMAKEIADAGGEVPDWLTGMGEGGWGLGVEGKEGKKAQFEGLDQMFKRIQEAAATKDPVLRVAERQAELSEEQLGQLVDLTTTAEMENKTVEAIHATIKGITRAAIPIATFGA